MITSLLGLIIVGVVLGIIYWLVGAIPFIPPMFKQVLQWIVILFAALILIGIASLAMPYLLRACGYELVRHKSGWLVQKDGKTYKVRALTESGVSLSPSVSKGAGRYDTEQNWEDGKSGIDGFIVFDAARVQKGKIQVWVLSMTDVDFMIHSGSLSAHGEGHRSDFFKRLGWVLLERHHQPSPPQ
jgi:hypothetical protein